MSGFFFDPFLLDPFFSAWFDGVGRSTYLTFEEVYDDEPPALARCPHCAPTRVEEAPQPFGGDGFVFREVPVAASDRDDAAAATSTAVRIPISSPAPPQAKKQAKSEAEELDEEAEMLAELIECGGCLFVEQLNVSPAAAAVYTVQIFDDEF